MGIKTENSQEKPKNKSKTTNKLTKKKSYKLKENKHIKKK